MVKKAISITDDGTESDDGNERKRQDRNTRQTFEPGDELFEVFIYKIRRAVVEKVYIDRLDNPSKTKVRVYEIRCLDGTMSPRYIQTDVGVRIFKNYEDAKKRLEYNLQCKRENELAQLKAASRR